MFCSKFWYWLCDQIGKKNLTYLYNNMHLLVCILYFKRIFPWIVQKSPIKPLMLLSCHFFLCIAGISWRLLNTVVRTLLGKRSSYAEISGLGPHSAPYSSFDMHLGSSPWRLGMSCRKEGGSSQDSGGLESGLEQRIKLQTSTLTARPMPILCFWRFTFHVTVNLGCPGTWIKMGKKSIWKRAAECS